MLYEVDWADDGTYRPGEYNSPEKFFNDCLENSKAEIEYDKIDKVRGMDINFITTATTDEEAKELLSLLGAPFAK